MQPHYYLMRCKKILRLEWDTSFDSLPLSIQENALSNEVTPMDQEQANWRVVIFRDEILEIEEYQKWLNSAEAFIQIDEDFELVAN